MLGFAGFLWFLWFISNRIEANMDLICLIFASTRSFVCQPKNVSAFEANIQFVMNIFASRELFFPFFVIFVALKNLRSSEPNRSKTKWTYFVQNFAGSNKTEKQISPEFAGSQQNYQNNSRTFQDRNKSNQFSLRVFISSSVSHSQLLADISKLC